MCSLALQMRWSSIKAYYKSVFDGCKLTRLSSLALGRIKWNGWDENEEMNGMKFLDENWSTLREIFSHLDISITKATWRDRDETSEIMRSVSLYIPGVNLCEVLSTKVNWVPAMWNDRHCPSNILVQRYSFAH